MEYNTCEQYVLAQLEKAQILNDMYRRNIQCLRERLDKATKEPDHVAQRVAEIGREYVFKDWFYASSSPSVNSFEEFCEDKIASTRLPDDVSKNAAIRFFEPELRELWQRILEIRKAQEEDAE